MCLNKRKIYTLLAIFLLIFDLLVNNLINIPILRLFYCFSFLMFFPGFLIIQLLKVESKSNLNQIVYIISLSIFFLMTFGLFLNSTFPFFGIHRPLSSNISLVGINIALLIMLIFSYLASTTEFKLGKSLNKTSFWKIVFYCLPFTFPILTIFGAISLNNSGSSFITMVFLALSSIYIYLIILLKDKISVNIIPVTIYLVSLSILFMTSLRGWYITGHDIQREFAIFEFTKNNQAWIPSFSHYAYNACLSITILPTLISNFTHMNDMYIYKIYYQLVFALCPVILYSYIKRFSNSILALFSSIIFISFPTFINDMPFLNRQEMGFIFFSVLFLALYDMSLRDIQRKILFYFFCIGIIISHYSTTYTTIALFFFLVIVNIILKSPFFLKFKIKDLLRRNVEKNDLKISYKTHVSFVMFIFFLLSTFLWNVEITDSAGGLKNVIFQTLVNMNSAYNEELKSGDVRYNILNWKKTNYASIFNGYVRTNIKRIHIEHIYNDTDNNNFKVSPTSDDILPLSSIGKLLTHFKINVYVLNYALRQYSAKAIQLFILVGILGMFILKKNIRFLESDFIILSIASIAFLVSQIVLPYIANEYGLARSLQQVLLFLAFTGSCGILIFFFPINEKIRFYLSGSVIVFLYLLLTGFIPQLLGGYNPQLNLNNAGFYYNSYYIHKSEIISIGWLTKNRNKNMPVQSDDFAYSKLVTFGKISSLNSLLPDTIVRDAYVYLDYANSINHKVTDYFDAAQINYIFPIKFLDSNKNLIYNNGETKIFK